MKYCIFFALTVVLAVSTVKARGSGYVLSEEEKQRCIADITFVLDASGSVQLENWRKTLQFVTQFAAQIPFNLNRFGVVSFGNEATINVELDDFRDYGSFRDFVLQIPYKDENTNTADGLRKMRTLYDVAKGDRLDIPNIAIIITDGVATMEVDQTQPMSQMIRQSDITLFGIGIGNALSMVDLVNIVGNDENVFTARDFNDLLANVDKILLGACRAIPTTPVPPPLYPCIDKDVAFVVDASGSVERSSFDRTKKFIKDFLASVPSEALLNYAMVLYSTETFVQYKLGEMLSRSEVFQKIDDLQHINQRTNLSGAIRVVREEIFKFPPPLQREQIAVVITDHKSNTDVDKLPLEVKLAKEKGIKLFSVALGKDADYYEMSLVASSPKYFFSMYMDGYDALSKTGSMEYVRDKVCAAAYPAPEFPIDKEGCYSDIVFAIDANRNSTIIQQQKRLIIELASALGPCLYGIIVNGRQSYTAVSFDSYESLSGFISRVENLYVGPDDSKSIASSLQVAENMFKSRPQNINMGTRRFRPPVQGTFSFGLADKSTSEMMHTYGVPQLLVMITDGQNVMDSNIWQERLGVLKREMPSLGIMSVGYKPPMDANFLSSLSSKPDNLFVMVEKSMDYLVGKYSLLAEAISSIVAHPIALCDFEKVSAEGVLEQTFCDFQNVEMDDFEWKLQTGPTLSEETGPAKACNGSFYAYIEATGQQPGDTALLMGRNIPVNHDKKDYCYVFYYNMNGHHTGKLEVVEHDREGKEVIHWVKSRHQGMDWKLGMVQVKAVAGHKIGFKATRFEGYSSDIAIDAIAIHLGACPVLKQFPARQYGYEWDL